ncbi:hypothetical protein UT300012_40450 [Paraclostridium bifermentans]
MNFIYSIVVYCYISFFGRIISYFIAKTEPSDQLSFIGSLLGGILSFAGVWLTIIYTKKQFKDDKRISVKPYLDIKLKNLSNSTNSFDLIAINKLNNLNLYEESFIGIELSNLGQGNCLECKLISIRIDGRKVNNGLNIGSIGVTDGSILREITFITWYGDILTEINEKQIDKRVKNCPDEFEYCTYKYPLNKIEMEFEYKDVLDNKYSKNIVIDVFIIFNIVLGEKQIFEFNSVRYEINENLTIEKLIK